MQLPRICMFHFRYHPIFSGAAVQSECLSQRLRELGHNVFVLTARFPGLASQEVYNGLKVYRTLTWNKYHKDTTIHRLIETIVFAISSAFFLVWHRHEFDVLHMHGYDALLALPLMTAHLLGKPVIVKATLVDSQAPLSLGGKVLKQLKYLSLRLADRIVCISTPLMTAYLQAGIDRSRLECLPNGVDVTRFHPVSALEKEHRRHELGLDIDGTYLCFIGDFIYRKGVDILIEVFSEIARTHERVYLLLIGPYEHRKLSNRKFVDDILAQITEQGLSPRFKMVGKQAEVEKYLQAADIFVFPSRREGFGTAIIEAMSVGLPCVVSGAYGVAHDIIADGEDGIIIEDNRAEGYVTAVCDLIERPETREMLGARARRSAEKKFSMDSLARVYTQLYQELTSKHR